MTHPQTDPPDSRGASRPWAVLLELARAGDDAALQAFVDNAGPHELARAFAHLDSSAHREILRALGAEAAADLIEQLSRVQAVEVVEHLSPAYAALVLNELPAEVEADIVRDLDDDDAEAVIAAMPAQDAAEVRALQRYEDDTAGGLMSPAFVGIDADATVSEAAEQLRAGAQTFRHFEIQYIYVLHGDGTLAGVLRLRDLILAGPTQSVRDVMIGDPVSVAVDTTLEELAELLEGTTFLGLPVLDAGRMVGVVRRGAILEEVGAEAYRDHLKATGIAGGEELRSMGLFPRAGRRLGWLSINIGLNVVAASVIAMYQDTLAAVIALAVFLPIISDMSGCSGNQAVAVSMRELSLGVATPADVLYVWRKELSVGLINGAALGLLLGGVAFAWKGNVWLGLVAGGALAVNTLIAVSIGGTVPLLLKGLGVDPALASGPVLTTITDLCGFLLVLAMATAMLPLLVS